MAGFWLVDEARDSLRLQATVRDGKAIAADLEHPFIKDPSLWKTDPGVQELFFTGTPMICEDIDSDARVPTVVRAYFNAQAVKKFVRLPTLLGGEVKGFIAVFHGERPPYEPAEIELAQALAHQAMFALQIGQAVTLEERNRMACDIHDTLAQGFSAVIIKLQATQDAKSKGLDALSGSAMSDRQTPNKASENTRQTNT